MMNPPNLELPLKTVKQSVILKPSGSTITSGQPRNMAGFASLVNLKEETCPVTRGRRIQISQMGVTTTAEPANSKTSKSFTEGTSGGNTLKKRWSFHSADHITEIMKEEKNLRPILSPKRRKSSATGLGVNRNQPETLDFVDETKPSKISAAGASSKSVRVSGEQSQKSDSSKHVLTTSQQSQHHTRYFHRHHRRSSTRGEGEEKDKARMKQRHLLDDYYLMRMDEQPLPSYRQFRVRQGNLAREPPPPPPDHISGMPDEILLRICKYLPKPALGSLGRTSQKFLRLIEDESLWKRLCVMQRMLNPEHLYVIMQRKPVYLRMARAHIPDPVEFPTDLTDLASSSQLAYLDLTSAMISPEALALIMKISPKIIKLSLEHLNVTKEVLESMMRFAANLEDLNLTMCYDLDPETLAQFFMLCQNLKELNMGCISASNWTTENLTVVTKSLPDSLTHLNFAGFRNTLNNEHVEIIASRCPKLIHLDLSDSADLDKTCLPPLIELKCLEHLSFSRCYGIEPNSYTTLVQSKTLKYLDLFSLFKESSLRHLGLNLQGIELNKQPFSPIARPTFGNKRSSIWLQRVRD